MEKINIAELLKDCPKGMELDCILFDDDVKVIFDGVDGINTCASIIKIVVIHDNNRISHALTKYGQWNPYKYAKCVIFPKGKTTWDGFVPPCKFKEGDVLYVDCADEEDDVDLYKYIFILKEIDSLGNYFSYCLLSTNKFVSRSHFLTDNRYTPRFATEEEKEKLLQAIKDNGYHWNAETKTLEKLVEPRFKVGDRIQGYGTHINYPIRVVKSLEWDKYRLDNGNYIKFGDEHAYKLLKFDITTLKPFDKVLIRYNENPWRIQFFERYDKELRYPFVCLGGSKYKNCIPYEGNEHLLGTTNDCDDFYKTWE